MPYSTSSLLSARLCTTSATTTSSGSSVAAVYEPRMPGADCAVSMACSHARTSVETTRAPKMTRPMIPSWKKMSIHALWACSWRTPLFSARVSNGYTHGTQ